MVGIDPYDIITKRNELNQMKLLKEKQKMLDLSRKNTATAAAAANMMMNDLQPSSSSLSPFSPSLNPIDDNILLRQENDKMKDECRQLNMIIKENNRRMNSIINNKTDHKIRNIKKEYDFLFQKNNHQWQIKYDERELEYKKNKERDYELLAKEEEKRMNMTTTSTTTNEWNELKKENDHLIQQLNISIQSQKELEILLEESINENHLLKKKNGAMLHELNILQAKYQKEVLENENEHEMKNEMKIETPPLSPPSMSSPPNIVRSSIVNTMDMINKEKSMMSEISKLRDAVEILLEERDNRMQQTVTSPTQKYHNNEEKKKNEELTQLIEEMKNTINKQKIEKDEIYNLLVLERQKQIDENVFIKKNQPTSTKKAFPTNDINTIKSDRHTLKSELNGAKSKMKLFEEKNELRELNGKIDQIESNSIHSNMSVHISRRGSIHIGSDYYPNNNTIVTTGRTTEAEITAKAVKEAEVNVNESTEELLARLDRWSEHVLHNAHNVQNGGVDDDLVKLPLLPPPPPTTTKVQNNSSSFGSNNRLMADIWTAVPKTKDEQKVQKVEDNDDMEYAVGIKRDNIVFEPPPPPPPPLPSTPMVSKDRERDDDYICSRTPVQEEEEEGGKEEEEEDNGDQNSKEIQPWNPSLFQKISSTTNQRKSHEAREKNEEKNDEKEEVNNFLDYSFDADNDLMNIEDFNNDSTPKQTKEMNIQINRHGSILINNNTTPRQEEEEEDRLPPLDSFWFVPVEE